MSTTLLDRAALWHTLRLLGSCTLAFVGARLAGLPETYWALVTAVIVTQPMLSDTLSAGRERVLGTLVGAAIGFLVLVLVQHGLPLMPLFWLALAGLAFLIAKRPYLRLAPVTLIVVTLIPGTGAPFVRPFDRVAEIILGTLAAILVAAAVRPKLAAEKAADAVEAQE